MTEPAAKSNPGDRLAIIAGNGRFPFLVLEAARDQGIDPLVIGIQEEASSELSQAAHDCRWVSLGEVAKLLEILRSERVTRALLAGQVKHTQLFSSIPPDGLVRRALGGLDQRNTDALIGAFVRMLEGQGVRVVDSTLFLKPLLAPAGSLTRRAPDASEQADIDYGRELAMKIVALDIGQTIVVADRACMAVEAMEGTDETIRRAAKLSNGRRLVVVKVSKPNQDMRFDVPVVGPRTIGVMREANARALAVDAGRTLLFERDRLLEEANAAGIAISGLGG